MFYAHAPFPPKIQNQFSILLSLLCFIDMESPFDCLLFDLDDTLYSSATGIAQVCRRNIEEYLMRKCGVSAERASSLRVEHFRSSGSSLASLIAVGYDVDPDDYHSFVHGTLPYEQIKPDHQLRELLCSIPQTKIIFTNSDRKHTKRVLERLGIEECFNLVICFETINPHLFEKNSSSLSVDHPPPPVLLKPSIAAMGAAVRLAGFNPQRTLFLDDRERNIASGKSVGLRTALVGKKVKSKEADYLVEDMGSLRLAIPEIWGKKGNEEHEMVVTSDQLDATPQTTEVEA